MLAPLITRSLSLEWVSWRSEQSVAKVEGGEEVIVVKKRMGCKFVFSTRLVLSRDTTNEEEEKREEGQ